MAGGGLGLAASGLTRGIGRWWCGLAEGLGQHLHVLGLLRIGFFQLVGNVTGVLLQLADRLFQLALLRGGGAHACPRLIAGGWAVLQVVKLLGQGALRFREVCDPILGGIGFGLGGHGFQLLFQRRGFVLSWPFREAGLGLLLQLGQALVDRFEDLAIGGEQFEFCLFGKTGAGLFQLLVQLRQLPITSG